MAEIDRGWKVVAEVDPNGDGGSLSNYSSDRQADLLRERTRKLAAAAHGETGPNVRLTDEERRIAGERAER